ncbi:hypothetical protein [Streptomyces subrutilus]|uniref:DUF2273 domain-containing protein n=1 Tax=Streptomyces subrutilus TaxID=36818 RepID=A0A5P2UQV7_9ACTN|nr:hypothetical protein [Streptomyces subrutilus]QEU81726.1 hypothetical protein CP968_28635 [Streptomyces subrutilus]WSJ28849.1 hypothetical protein OG479_05740 [Streptomyces subrutilus]
MSRDVLGLFVGMALAFAGWFGGFGAFLLVAALGALGFFAGHHLDRGGDVRDFLTPRERRGR